MSLLRDGYTDINRAFLQAFMSRRVMKVNDIKPILAAILSADSNEQEVAIEDINDRIIASYVSTANTAIHNYDLEIRSTLDQKDRSRIYALINIASDELVQIATTHSADEIAFFKRVLDEMFDINNTPSAEIMAVTSFQALKLNKNPNISQTQATQAEGTQTTGAGLTKSQAEECLDAFVEEGWLEKSDAGWYSLTSRALMELASYLTQTYNTPTEDDDDDEEGTRSGAIVERIKQCFGCKEIITVGYRCQALACNFRLHESCATQYFRAQRNGKECPACGAPWIGKGFVGEKAGARRRISQGPPNVNRRQSGQNGAGRGRNGTVTQIQPAVVETEEEEDSDENVEGESD